jgi:hypothetical protein
MFRVGKIRIGRTGSLFSFSPFSSSSSGSRKRTKKKRRSAPKRVRSRSHSSTKRIKVTKRTSHRKIHYTKKGQPFIILASGKARFITKRGAKSAKKRKGGRY